LKLKNRGSELLCAGPCLIEIHSPSLGRTTEAWAARLDGLPLGETGAKRRGQVSQIIVGQ
jgi:hypothetical protein